MTGLVTNESIGSGCWSKFSLIHHDGVSVHQVYFPRKINKKITRGSYVGVKDLGTVIVVIKQVPKNMLHCRFAHFQERTQIRSALVEQENSRQTVDSATTARHTG